jgi:tRNA(adenine34) deaminase
MRRPPTTTTPTPYRRYLRAVATPPMPTDADARMMGRALELARRAESIGEVPVGAVVWNLRTGEIAGEGHNERETANDPSAHAEHLAITRAARAARDWRLTSHALAVTLEPCPMCAGLIVNARLPRVVYGAPDPKAGACRSLYRLLEDPRLNHRVTPVAGVRADESAALLTRFFRARRRAAPPKP